MTGGDVQLHKASAGFGDNRLWEGLDLSASKGSFVAILGANGTGKTTLLRTLLGLHRLSGGEISILGSPPTRGDPRIGYIPQQRSFEPRVPLRAIDLVSMGLDGHHWGLSRRRSKETLRVMEALRMVGAEHFAHAPMGLLSGGQQQRARIAQALVGDPDIILADEPLLSLDPRSQQEITAILELRRRSKRSLVMVVTHDINPVRPFVDKVLYLAKAGWAVGTAEEVITSETLTRLYGVAVDVLNVRGRTVVLSEYGADIESALTHPHDAGPSHVP